MVFKKWNVPHNKNLSAKYLDREWLNDKYWKEGLSINEIAELCKVGYAIIWYWLNKLGIPRRSQSEANHLARGNHCILLFKSIEWVNGELLGDGYLRSDTIYSARFAYTSKHLEYIQYISDTLKSFGIEQSGKIREEYNKNQGNHSYRYHSLHYEELYPIYKRWYPKGKKIVPKDIKLTPLTCRQWYIGDGCLQHSKRMMKFIVLHTNGFKPNDVEWLKNRLTKMGFISTRRLSDNAIGISAYSTKGFLDYIGDCPVDCYRYKWKY